MCFGRRGKKADGPESQPAFEQAHQQHQQQYQPQGPGDVKSASGPGAQAAQGGGRSAAAQDAYAPPAGPPPGWRDEYAPPPGPPPGHGAEEYAPPPGSPPGHGRPPVHDGAEKPQHDWQAAVPDTALFPPPPAFFSGHDRSHTTNAPEDEAVAGEAWCQQHPLVMPLVLDEAGQAALRAHNIRLMQPAGFDGTLNWLGNGHWEVSTPQGSPDRCIIGYPPLYVVNAHDVTRFKTPKTIYYEIKLLSSSREVSVAMGFTALPYPSFRMPGWHRGSLAVHGDDGHKYINDRWGGKDFAAEFVRGETYGIGMTLAPAAGGGARPSVRVFFTRNGACVGGWDLHEETDADGDLPVTGLEGLHDLSCAVGTFDGLSLEVMLDPATWMYRETK